MRNHWVPKEKLLDTTNNQQVLEELSLWDQMLQPRWWMQPSKPQTSGSAWGLSLMPGEMAFHPTESVLCVKSWVAGVEELQEVMSSLHSTTRECEKEIGRIFSEAHSCSTDSPHLKLKRSQMILSWTSEPPHPKTCKNTRRKQNTVLRGGCISLTLKVVWETHKISHITLKDSGVLMPFQEQFCKASSILLIILFKTEVVKRPR